MNHPRSSRRAIERQMRREYDQLLQNQIKGRGAILREEFPENAANFPPNFQYRPSSSGRMNALVRPPPGLDGNRPYYNPYEDGPSQDLSQVDRSLVKLRTPRVRHNTHKIPPLSRINNQASANVLNILRSDLDRSMASRQINIESLHPRDRQQQDAWARQQLEGNPGHQRSCVVGYPWTRIIGGYRCEGQRHLVTDELLAEGKGGCYVMDVNTERNNPAWTGPFYGDDIQEETYRYTGPPGQRTLQDRVGAVKYLRRMG
jgi:hypothetical protein